MRINITILTILVVFFGASPAFAGDPPTQINPSDTASVTSSKVEWQTPSYQVYSSNPYRVQVDDGSSFPSATINKDYYTDNTSYTPQLTSGIWYWRVKARDTSGVWSNWSNVWAFTLSNSTPSPTPTPAPSPSPSPLSTSSTSSSSSSSSFTISNIPSQINSDQAFNVSVNLLLPNNPNTAFYLKGAFKKAEGSNYFGLTKVGSSWIKNGATFSNQYSLTSDSSGNWSGNIEIQPDSEDSGYTGTGDYIFKLGRYASSGSGPTWSNESTVKIIAVENTDQGGIVADTSSNTISSSLPEPGRLTKGKTTPSKSKNYDRLVYHSASIEGIKATSTSSATPSAEVRSQKQINFPLIIGVVLVIGGVGSLIYVYLRHIKIS